MKKSFAFLLMTLFISVSLVSAQTEPSNIMVHEVIVKPSMDSKYRDTMKKLKAACELHKTSFGWTAVSYNDASYIYLSPMNSFADLDKNVFADLEAKMGKEALGKIWADFGECYESSSDYVATFLPEFSYLAPAEGENYRNVTTWSVLPGKEAEGESVLREWKKLNESKKSAEGYLIYRVAYGREPAYKIVSWGKTAVEEATKAQKNQELLGEEGGKMWMKTQAISKKYSNKRADVLPAFSYTPPK